MVPCFVVGVADGAPVPLTMAQALNQLLPPPEGKKRIVLVTGGRSFTDAHLVNVALTAADPGMVIEGGATGTDRLCRVWAHAHGVHTLRVDALWDFYAEQERKGVPGATRGKAGPVRNSAMVRVASMLRAVVVAFPGGEGTADLVGKAGAAKLDVIEIQSEP